MRPPIVFMPLWIKPSVLKKEVTMFAAEATTEPQKLNLLESLFNLLESLFIADDNPDFLIPALTPDFTPDFILDVSRGISYFLDFNFFSISSKFN